MCTMPGLRPVSALYRTIMHTCCTLCKPLPLLLLLLLLSSMQGAGCVPCDESAAWPAP